MAQPLLDQQILVAISAAVVAGLQNLPTPTVNVQSDISKPGKYKGEKGRDLDRFLSQCELYWVTANVTDDHKRVVNALNRFEDKAAQWSISITDHMAAHAGTLPAEVDTWAKFKALLEKFFGDATPEDTAIMELDKLCRLEKKEKDTRDVAHYVTDFKAAIARITGLSNKDKEI